MFYAFTAAALLLPALSLAAPALEPRQDWGAVTNSVGLSFFNPDLGAGTAGKANPSDYTCYSGPASNFPDPSTWISFNSMWAMLAADELTPIGDSADEQAAMLAAITRVAKNSMVDARVILATIVDESTGNVNVGCTNNGVQNCGLMQSHNPVDTAFDASDVSNSILQMVRDGVRGTPSGPGLLGLFNDDALTGGNLWNVFRAYNSGSIDAENLSDPMGATAAYVSNMANYLTGWNGWGSGPTPCGF